MKYKLFNYFSLIFTIFLINIKIAFKNLFNYLYYLNRLNAFLIDLKKN